MVWYKDGIRQPEMTKEVKSRDIKSTKREEDADDLYVDRTCKQAWSDS